MKNCIGITLVLIFTLTNISNIFAQEIKRIDPRLWLYIFPVRIVWSSDTSGQTIKNIESLLRRGSETIPENMAGIDFIEFKKLD